MNLYLLHFLLFAPSDELPQRLVRGLSAHFPNLSLTREEDPQRFLAALGSRRWDMIFLFSPLEKDFIAALDAQLGQLDVETPVILCLSAAEVKARKWPELHYPFLTTVAAHHPERFLGAIGQFLITAQTRKYAANLHKLMDFLDDGLFVLDVFGNILYANTALAAMQGGKPEALLGRNYLEFVPSHLAARSRAAFEQVLGGRRVWSKVVVSESPRRVLQMDIFPLEQEGQRVAVGGILRDITSAEIEHQREMAYRHRRESQYIALTKLGTHPELLGGHWERALELLLATSVQTLKVAGGEFWMREEDESGEICFRCHCSEGEGLPVGTTFRLAAEEKCWADFRRGRLLAIEGFGDEGGRFTPYRSLLPSGSALIAMPLVVRGRVAGLLIHHQPTPRRWFADELSFVERLTAYLSQAYLAVELRRRNTVLHRLTLAGRSLEMARTLEEMADGIREVVALMGFTWLAIVQERRPTADERRREMMQMAIRRRVGEVWERESPPDAQQMEAIEQALLDARPFEGRLGRTVVPATKEGERPLPALITEAWRWENRSASLLLGGGPLPLQEPLDEETVHLLNMLADIVAAACDRIRFIHSLQVEQERMGLVHQLTQHLLESLDPREVARRALDELCLFLGASQGVVSLFPAGAERGGKLLVARGFSGEQWMVMAHFLLEVDEMTLTRWVLTNRVSVILDDAHQDPRWYPLEGVDDHVHSVISVPLLGKGQVLGVLNLYSEEPNFFDRSHLQLVESVASTIAVALYNAQLFRQEQERRRFAEALEEAVAVVNSNLQFDEMMDRILEQVERVIGGDTFNIMLLQKQEVRIVRWRGYEKMIGSIEMPMRPFPLDRYPSLMKMQREGCSVCIPDTRRAEEWVAGKGDRWRRSYVGAPIRVAGVTVGFLNANSAHPDYFNETHARRLEAFAEHAAIAIRNARLYQTLQQYAGQLERRVEERTAELLAQYARLNAVLNSTTNGIVVTDAEGTIIQSNPVATRWLTQHFSPEEARTLREKIRQMALRGRERPEEVVEFGPVALHLRASPVRGGQENSDIGHVVIAIDDVSQLKALERMKAQFISNISHELRTPLTAIKLYAQLLRRKWETDSGGDKDVAGYLDALEREIAHQAALVEEVLNFARLDAGKATLELKKVDIVEIVQAVWVEMQMMASAQGLNFLFEADEPLWGEVDVGKVQRAVRNLLINAIRYTEAGGRVLVAVHPCLFADGREGACIRVEDTGMGIAESDMEHLFERFYRGEEVQRRQIPGTGLGLAIVKEVVRLHQGMCTVHSEVGKGTTFTIRLPLHPRKKGDAVGDHPLERRTHGHTTRR